jgi:phosphatidylglycerol:prolipoprotein diacylglycerol transferase
MQLPLEAVRSIEVTAQMLEHAAEINGNTFVQVHPTFLYESAWNFVLVALMVLVTLNKGFKRFDGLIFCMYLTGYGIGRFWIEGLRTDQLLIPGTAVPVSQALSAVLVAAGIILFITLMVRNKRRLRGARTDNY